MTSGRKLKFDTRIIHGGLDRQDWEGATHPPIFQSASHRHETADQLSRTFSGETSDHIYMRLTNPTNRFLEEKLADLENGKAAVVTGSGMAAVANACMALLRAGDEFVSGSSLFLSTWILFSTVFKKYGITAVLKDPLDKEGIAAAIGPKTRFIYVETIGNPKMDVPDIEAIAGIAHDHGLPLIVDNTLATPWLFRPLDHGADVVVHSTTKFLGGHGAAPGGVIIDGGRFDWTGDRFADFAPFVERKGDLAFTDRVWREHHINFGTTQAPFHSFLTCLGLDTLAVRMERHMANARNIAEFLENHPAVAWVNYPGLENHPDRSVAERQFQGKGFGAMLTFGLKDRDACFRFIDRLKLVVQLANLGDCKTLVIHPASSQYVSFTEDTRQELAILPEMIRLSVGIEAFEDIESDLSQALDGV